MDAQSPLDEIYTADEAAAWLKVSRRLVIKTGKRFGLCLMVGRQIRFTGRHLRDLPDALAYVPSTDQQIRYASRLAGDKAFDRLRQRVIAEHEERDKAKAARRAAAAKDRERQRQEKEAAKQAKRDERAARSSGRPPQTEGQRATGGQK